MEMQSSTTVRQMPSFLKQANNIRLLLFGGKGGVGKTTSTAAAALYFANHFLDSQFLIVSTDPAHSVKDSYAEAPLPFNLTVVEIDAEESLRKFKEKHVEHLSQIAKRGTFLDDDDITRLLNLSLPGLDEIMAFKEIADYIGRYTYDCVIVDTAPTGHTLRFLALPEMLRKWVKALDAMLAKHRYMSKLYRGFYRKDGTDLFLESLAEMVDSVASVLRDPCLCRFVPVMLPEALSINETKRLVDVLEKANIPVTELLVNKVFPSSSECPVCSNTHGRQSMELDRIRKEFHGYVLWEIPLHASEVRGQEHLSVFWKGVSLSRKRSKEVSQLPLLPFRVSQPAHLPQSDTTLILFAGKGGVGKTTLAAATALRLAEEFAGKEILLFSTDPAHSLSDRLGTRIGSKEVRLCPGLSAIEVDAEEEFEKLKDWYAKDIGNLFDSITNKSGLSIEFDGEVMQHILDLSPPGLDEIMAMTRAVDLLEGKKYDIFVFDTAPTGHLIRLLELPELTEEWLKVFFDLLLKYKNVFRVPKISDFMVTLSKRIKALRSVIADPRRGRLYAVATLTEMTFLETRDLMASCSKTGIRVPGLFLNMVTPRNNCDFCKSLYENEQRVHSMFKKSFKNIYQTTVFRCGEPNGKGELVELGHALFQEK